MNDIGNSLIIVLLVVYCLFILFHTKGEYSKLLLNKIIQSEETKIDVNEIAKPKLEIDKPKRQRKGSIVKISPDGAVENII